MKISFILSFQSLRIREVGWLVLEKTVSSRYGMNKMVNVIKSLKYQLYQVSTQTLFFTLETSDSSTDLEVGAFS